MRTDYSISRTWPWLLNESLSHKVSIGVSWPFHWNVEPHSNDVSITWSRNLSESRSLPDQTDLVRLLNSYLPANLSLHLSPLKGTASKRSIGRNEGPVSALQGWESCQQPSPSRLAPYEVPGSDTDGFRISLRAFLFSFFCCLLL